MFRSILSKSVVSFLFLLPLIFAKGLFGSAQSPSLQNQIDQAKTGAAVQLEPGVYTGPVTIHKSVNIVVSQPGAVQLVNSSDQPALHITADNVRISGLHIEDRGLKQAATVLVHGDDVTLDRLQITTGSFGIFVENAAAPRIVQNTVRWEPHETHTLKPSDRKNGIHLYYAPGGYLEGNMIEQALDGIYLESSHDTTAIRNHIERSRYGIHLMYTDRMKISDNSGTMNYTGAMIMVVKDSEVTGNLFRMQQENVNAQGILLYDTHETLVQDNVMDGNRIGLLVQQSTDNDFRHNQISRNFVGMQIHRSEQNTITRNVFLGNVLDAQADQSTKNDIIYNYLEAFRGIDTDGDGISNLDYAIHPFSYRLFQKQPAFQLLFQSPSMALLERMFQLGQEQWMKDVAPLMAPPFPIKATAIASSGQFMIWFGIGGLSFVIILLIWARRRIV